MSFDHHSEEFSRTWVETFADLRATCPVAHSDEHGGFHVLTRYADVRSAARDWHVFSTENDLDGTGNGGRGIQIPSNPVRMGMLEMDPPANLGYRRLLLDGFSPAAALAYEPRLRHLVGTCIDAFIERGTCDVVADLGNPIPAMVTLDYLGIPLDRAARYGDILHRSVCTLRDSMAFGDVLAEIGWLIQDLARIVTERQSYPGTDLISTLLASQIDGELLSIEVVTEMLFMILNGGVDTTTGVIASMLLWLSENPDQQAWLQADISRTPVAVEEFLRFMPPALGSGRNIVAEVEVSGSTLAPGERVYLAWASANRDSEKFTDADVVHLDRTPNPHLSFGHGAHKCIGAPLARVELRVVLEEVLRRLPDLTIEPSDAVPYADIGVISAFTTMPATFTAGMPLTATVEDGAWAR